MEIVCLDMEGTLTPEIWERVAEDTGVEELGMTTIKVLDSDQALKELSNLVGINFE